MSAHTGLMWAAAAAALAAAVTIVKWRRRGDPYEKERRRRELVNQRGRVIEGYVTAWGSDTVQYSYQWRGVRYETAQDVTGLVEPGLIDFSGPATVKFLTSRPSNSIVIAESWSGVPGVRQRIADSAQ